MLTPVTGLLLALALIAGLFAPTFQKAPQPDPGTPPPA